jgi:hypothetical protein
MAKRYCYAQVFIVSRQNMFLLFGNTRKHIKTKHLSKKNFKGKEKKATGTSGWHISKENVTDWLNTSPRDSPSCSATNGHPCSSSSLFFYFFFNGSTAPWGA